MGSRSGRRLPPFCSSEYAPRHELAFAGRLRSDSAVLTDLFPLPVCKRSTVWVWTAQRACSCTSIFSREAPSCASLLLRGLTMTQLLCCLSVASHVYVRARVAGVWWRRRARARG